MSARQIIAFALRQLRREWKAGELFILCGALLIAIASHTAINHFTTRLSATMAASANDVIGGDLALVGNRPASAEMLREAERLGLRAASAMQFSSVIGGGGEILLVGVKAVDRGYPLKGQLKVADEMYGATAAVRAGPPAGEAWVELRVLRALGLELGDAFELGTAQLTATRVLAFEPDRGRNFYSLTPRVMINQDDLARTGIVQPGSRVQHRRMFAGGGDAIAQYRAWLAPRLAPGQRVRGLDEERPAVASALAKARQYMGLASLVALLLAAVAIAASGRHYSERHYDATALLRCLGCTQRDILAIYLLQLIALALLGGLLGNALGYLAQSALIAAIAQLLPDHLAPAQWATFRSGMLLSFVVLLGFTLPSVLRLKSVPPQRALRRDLAPMPPSAWLVQGATALLVAAMMWRYSGSLTLAAATMAGAAAALAIGAALLLGLFSALARLLPTLPTRVRAGLRNLLRRRGAATAQTMAFGLTIMAMLVVVLIRTELLDAWHRTIPADAPNHFVLNIQPRDAEDYAAYLRAQQVQAGRLYPVVRGRLTRLNGRPMTAAVSKEAQDGARAHDESLRRDLNLTWSARLPPDNQLLAGAWWSANETAPLVSVEADLARRLGIDLGDRLTLFTGEREWSARVASIRRVQWDNFKPNFYLVFNRAALDRLPTTWINSFRLDGDDKDKLAPLVKRFPSITLLEVDAILNQIEDIIAQVTLALEAILGFVLAAGVMVTLASVAASLDQRLREGALLRTLGADRAAIVRSQWSEFAGMGLIAGAFGVAGAEIINALLYRRVFDLDYTPAWWAWVLIPLAAAALIGLVGVAASRRVLRQSPLAALRRG